MNRKDPHFQEVPYGLILSLHPKAKQAWEIGKPSPEDPILHALGEIEHKRLLGFLPYLAPLALSPAREVRDAAGRTVERLFETDLPAGLSFLSTGLGMHVHYETGVHEKLRDITAKQVETLSDFPSHAAAIFGLLSFHASGWVREAAVKRLAKLTDGNDIPFLLYRAHDWVESIARKAATALEARLNALPIRRFSAHLPVLFQLRTRQRGHLGELQERILQRIALEEEIAFLTETARTAKAVDFRRWVLSLANSAAQTRPEAAMLVLELRHDTDPVIRSSAWSRIWDDPHCEIDLHEGLRDSWPSIRRRCLEVLCASDPAREQAVLLAALFDNAGTVRATARYFLKAVPDVDPAEQYRDRLRDAAAPPPAALFGLAECGHKDDAPLSARFLDSPRVALRRAAILALGHLDADTFASSIRAALHDPAPGVSKTAGLVLQKHPRLLSRNLLLGALDKAQPLHVRRQAIRLVSALRKWDRILLLLEALAQAREFNDVVQDAIRLWLQQYNQNFTQPTSEQIADFKRFTALHGHHLSSHLVAELVQIAAMSHA